MSETQPENKPKRNVSVGTNTRRQLKSLIDNLSERKTNSMPPPVPNIPEPAGGQTEKKIKELWENLRENLDHDGFNKDNKS